MRRLLIIVMVVIGTPFTGCSKPGAADKKAGPATTSMPATKSDNVIPSFQSSADGKLVRTGSLALEIGRDYVKGSIRGYLLGFEGQYILSETAGEDSTSWQYQIAGLPPATYELMIFGTTPPTAALPGGQVVGLRVGDIEIPTGGIKKLSVPKLQKGATVTGKGALLGLPAPTGMGVRIQGTHLHGDVDGEGAYTITDVPLGRYTLEFDCDGYQNGFIAEVDLTSASAHQMVQITLFKPEFVGSGFTVEQKDGVIKGKEATLIMAPPAGAYFMKIGETPTLKDASWQPLITTMTRSFTSLGDKSLYVQFADKDQANPSSIYTNSFTLSSAD